MRRTRGFTLLEVMLALSLLGFGLVVLLKSTAGNVYAAREAQMMGVVTDLSRGKMYDIEETLLKDGFSETDIEEDGTFDDEGWGAIAFKYKVEQVELPTFEELKSMAMGRNQGSGAGPGSGSDAGSDGEAGELGGFGDSALGGMLMSMGGLGGEGDGASAESAAGASFIQGQYQMVQETLKASIRKVTLDVTYQVGINKRELRTVAFFTDPAAMDKVLSGLGSQELPEDGGSGSGSGAGSGSSPTTPRGPRSPRSNK